MTQSKGELDASIRTALVAAKPVSGTLGAFAIKVQENSASITDAHIAALKAAGCSDEQIFECIIAAAVGAGMVRLEAGLALLGIRP
ncbi:MAG: carboxymuconolactone decarboxylase family protein [Polyangiaceae bacterium]